MCLLSIAACLLDAARLSMLVIVDSANCLSVTKLTPMLKKLIPESCHRVNVTLYVRHVHVVTPDVDVVSPHVDVVSPDVGVVSNEYSDATIDR